MKYWDTSALLRAWKEGWVPREGFTRSHTLAEWFHIQVGRGLVFTKPDGSQEKRAMTWPLAAYEAKKLSVNLSFLDLTPAQVFAALDDLAKIPDLKASVVHDFMHVRSAEVNKATSIVTLNLEEWAKLTRLKLEPPAKP